MISKLLGRVFAIFFTLIAFTPVFTPVLSAQEIGTIHFRFDSDQLDEESRAQVSAIVERLTENPSYKPTIVVGYTDAVGPSSYNQGLGLRRAKRVASALVAAGVPVNRIGPVSSRGKNDLVVAAATAERRNRRVKVSLDDMLSACRSYREIDLNPAGFGEEFQSDLKARLEEAAAAYARFAADGENGPAFQMAGAARYDCTVATGENLGSGRKLEYGQKCFCNSARLRVALTGR